MIRGIGASRMAMAWEQSRTDVIAGNVANVDTEGFKRSVAVGASFGDLLLRRLSDPPGSGAAPALVGPLGLGAVLDLVSVDRAPGVISKSDGPLDVALDGPGDFVYQAPAGPGYTRRGAFQRDAAGLLTTAEGFPVLVNGAPVGAGAKHLSIAEDGQVVADGTPVGRLDLRGQARHALWPARWSIPTSTSLRK